MASVDDPVAFDPNDPVDALADRFRHAVLQATLDVVTAKDFAVMSKGQRVQGTFAGLMVGACCAMIGSCEPEGHEELRAMMTQWFPYYFDAARAIGKLPLLPAQPSAGEAVVRRIGQVATAVGFQANEGAADIAGQILSSLYASPEQIERFMREGSELLVDGTISPDNGALNYRSINGTIVNPSDRRRARGMQQ